MGQCLIPKEAKRASEHLMRLEKEGQTFYDETGTRTEFKIFSKEQTHVQATPEMLAIFKIDNEVFNKKYEITDEILG